MGLIILPSQKLTFRVFLNDSCLKPLKCFKSVNLVMQISTFMFSPSKCKTNVLQINKMQFSLYCLDSFNFLLDKCVSYNDVFLF